ncbi:UDP-N-acetylmuramoyl-tripeptide--D-alanyl-D-alanine ligase [Enterococcus mediterraneensis]|uniref:UDP-N-acetylmuramoyl-tripeptide--D-alanyl-D- alanine ligase n=1 Tax=Enterococcus mediterraneensis TaxID=2364791 RepID=UPI000F04FF53|nr:UDP-N-acetylmuramoyl-tripeptide--D-alanyl-D-alanine ligase [Enterococcus mediterraneensis]
MKLTIKEIAQVLEIPNIDDSREIHGVEFDSRKIQSGDLFIPFSGQRDGHDFVQDALDNGAIATLWSRDTPAPEGIIPLPVKSTLAATQKLAGYYLKKIKPKVIGITGSNGKTTTKDMTESVLSQKFKTYKTQGNYNNDIGLPYTVFQTPEDCEMLILEMGMDRFNEIRELTTLAQPDAAAITLIGEAHIENLGSREGIAKAKMEIVEGLKKDGLLLIPSDEPLLDPLTKDLSQEIQTFGMEKGDLTAQIISEDREHTSFKINDTVFEIPVLGTYNVKNALIAYGFGRYFGLSNEEIKKGLAEVQLTKNRTEWLKAGNGADLLSDVYNANPTAMGLVLDTVAKIETSGRKIAVLADMLELGSDSAQLHAQMAEHVVDAYDLVFLYGEEMKALLHALKDEETTITAFHFEKNDKQELIQTLKKEIRSNDTIVLKGSNGMGLLEVVEELENME